MTWQSIAGGANGIIYYAFHTLSAPHDDPDDAFEPAWARVRSAAAEVKRYEDVLLSDTPVAVSCDVDAVAARAWRHGGRTHLLAVNCTTNAQTATISISRDPGTSACVELGSASVDVKGRKAKFLFPPLEYAMVRFE